MTRVGICFSSVTLFVALSAAGCLAQGGAPEDQSVPVLPTSTYGQVHGSDSDELGHLGQHVQMLSSESRVGAGDRQVNDDRNGPHPDPWKRIDGPHPDPWQVAAPGEAETEPAGASNASGGARSSTGSQNSQNSQNSQK